MPITQFEVFLLENPEFDDGLVKAMKTGPSTQTGQGQS